MKIQRRRAHSDTTGAAGAGLPIGKSETPPQPITNWCADRPLSRVPTVPPNPNLARFARAWCDDCRHDYFLAYSCKGRGEDAAFEVFAKGLTDTRLWCGGRHWFCRAACAQGGAGCRVWVWPPLAHPRVIASALGVRRWTAGSHITPELIADRAYSTRAGGQIHLASSPASRHLKQLLRHLHHRTGRRQCSAVVAVGPRQQAGKVKLGRLDLGGVEVF